MPTFDYRADDDQGHRRKGRLEADTPRHARQLLRERGLWPRDIKEIRVSGGANKQGNAGRLSAADLALLTLQLSTLVQAGLPLEESLEAVAKQTAKRRVASLLSAVRSRVMEGHALAAALAQFPKAFPELFRATVAAGERSGHLGHVLEQLAAYTQARQASRQKIQMALVYPLILMLASLVIVGFLLGYVVPDVVKIFVDSGQPLPWLTRVLIRSSDGLRNHGLLLLAALVLLIAFWRWSLSQRAWRLRWPRLAL